MFHPCWGGRLLLPWQLAQPLHERSRRMSPFFHHPKLRLPLKPSQQNAAQEANEFLCSWQHVWVPMHVGEKLHMFDFTLLQYCLLQLFPRTYIHIYIYIYIALQIHIFPVTVLIHSWDTRIWTPSRHPILLKFSFHQNGQQKGQQHPRPEWTKAAPEVGMRTRTRAGWRGQATRTGGSTWLRGASDTGQKFEFTLEKNSPLKSWIMQCIVGFFCQWLIFIKQKKWWYGKG